MSDFTHRRSLQESDPQRQEVDGGARGRGRGVGSECFMGRVSVWEDEKVLEMMVEMVAQQCECA